MNNLPFRTFVVALLVAFISQSFAAPMHCATDVSDNGHKSHKSLMKHNMHADDNMSHHQESKKTSCCSNGCSCAANVCSSLSSVPNYNIFRLPIANQHKISQLFAALIKPDMASLFKPPIFP
ncbi:hypothetical protein [Aliiglaciecola lipolytica]|uniref:hypothetical protein n=1 Tax=Aliiglaciecola lipolytica TaxID=477689 RepID=UPI00129D021D|nr:hypothetical protein [Aliiglaciecola lipolytica]